MPKVSVIIPVYGVEMYIEKCARSLFEQTLDDIEFIFVNDCTQDKSIDILNQVLDEYPFRNSQVIIHTMKRNMGQAKVREWGMCNATGEFIIYCDSDDWVDPEMYEAMYNLAKQKESDILICDYYISTGECDRHVKQHIPESKDELLGYILEGKVHSSCCNKLIKHSLYDKVEIWPKTNMREDLVLMTQLVYYSKSFAYMPCPFYHYWINQSSISQNVEIESIISRYKQSIQNYKSIESFLSDKQYWSQYKSEIQYLQFHIKVELAPLSLCKDKFYYWRGTFPSLKIKDILLLKIPLKIKLKYLLCCIVELLKML